MTTITAIDTHHPLLLQHVEVAHLGGGRSLGQVIGVDGRMGENLIIAFTAGPLAAGCFMVCGLPRNNLMLTSPVSTPMGELRRTLEAAT